MRDPWGPPFTYSSRQGSPGSEVTCPAARLFRGRARTRQERLRRRAFARSSTLDGTCPRVPGSDRQLSGAGRRLSRDLTLKRQQAYSQATTISAVTAPPVIVEPDSLAAWLGLIGVVAGIALTTATNWLQSRSGDHAERQRELQAAEGQLIASATSIVILSGWYQGARQPAKSSPSNTLGTESEWVEKIVSALERLQIADRVIQRRGQKDVAHASRHVVSQATGRARGTTDSQSVNYAIEAFRQICDKT
jgi:hypothetical protein